MGCQICDNIILLWVARQRLTKYTKHCLENPNNIVGKIFRKRRHQSDSMCQLPPKIAKYWGKNKQFFWRQLFLKKSNLWNLASKKQIWQPWGAEAACTLFFIWWPVSDDNDSSAPGVKTSPCQHSWFWMAWSVEFCMRWKTGYRKTPNIATLNRDTALVGFNRPLRLCTWFKADCHCSIAKLWDRTCELL